MTTTSVFVYLQRPDNGEWVTVGRYSLVRSDSPLQPSLGEFRYAPSYLEAGFPWVIDPVNLPILDRQAYPASRYDGLTDVLRDITPDSWGKFILRKELGLGSQAHEFDYLYHSGNTDRWGALTVGATRSPSKSLLASPRMPKLDEMLVELQLMASRKDAKYPEIRRRLIRTLSSGGARPKATVRDGSVFWIVKPTIDSDAGNTALFEHACMRLADDAGLDVAYTELHQDAARTAVMVERFDRNGEQRKMVLSAATLLGTEYPASGNNQAFSNIRWSYPLLAQSLRAIGCPDKDLHELFSRMIFNVLIGNDDDHPRNHAVVWKQTQSRWRLSPAFDIVPNLVDEPNTLAMQLSQGRWDFSADALLADWRYFGFSNVQEASLLAQDVYRRVVNASTKLNEYELDKNQSTFIQKRIQHNAVKLGLVSQ